MCANSYPTSASCSTASISPSPCIAKPIWFTPPPSACITKTAGKIPCCRKKMPTADASTPSSKPCAAHTAATGAKSSPSPSPIPPPHPHRPLLRRRSMAPPRPNHLRRLARKRKLPLPQPALVSRLLLPRRLRPRHRPSIRLRRPALLRRPRPHQRSRTHLARRPRPPFRSHPPPHPPAKHRQAT